MLAADLVIKEDVALGGGIALGVMLVVGLLLWMRSRRTLTRRLSSASARLGQSEIDFDGFRLERAVSRLERDVSRAVERETNERASARRLAQAAEAMPVGLVIYDDDGDVVFSTVGTDSVFSGQHADRVVEGAMRDLVDQALETHEQQHQVVELYGPPRRTIELTARALDDGNRATGAFVLLDDISAAKRVEAVRRDFVANISHELKTPVGALSLLAETLRDERDPAVASRLSERMVEEAGRVARTIDDLLALSHIEAGEAPAREPVPVHLFVAEAVERVRAAAEQQDVRITVDEAPRRLQVMGERRQLVSALYNLLENSVKYSEAGGEIHITTEFADGRVDVRVEDNGIGIPDHDLERIFERFYRVDQARSRATGGTGLGLAIVRHVAANHDGKVSVESREGEGSRFTLSLPARPGPVAVRAEAS